jgi:hypothetical protein
VHVVSLLLLVVLATGCAATASAPAVAASTPSPAAATVREVPDEASFESLRLSGRPTVLAVLDPTDT